jgi:hypothetical protein
MIVLHIGTFKTGSTSIQHMLCTNKSYLKNLGWLYPDPDRLESMNHSKVNLFLNNENDGEDAWNKIVNEVKEFDGPNVVISFEGFFKLPSAKILLFKEKLLSLNKGEFKVVLYLRKQDGLIESGHLQRLKQGINMPKRYKGESLDYNPTLDYGSCYSAWAKVFGEKSIVLRPFGKKFFQGENTLYKDFFFHAMGLDFNALSNMKMPQKNPNSSLDAASGSVLFFLCEQNGVGLNHHSIVDELLRIQAVETSTAKSLYSQKQHAEFFKLYEKSNERLKGLIDLSVFDNDEVFQKEQVSELDVIERLGKLYRQRNNLMGFKYWSGKKMRLNNKVKQGMILLDSGWHDPEPFGVWSKGNSISSLVFRVSRKFAYGKGILLLISALYVSKKSPYSYVRIAGVENFQWLPVLSETELFISSEIIGDKANLIYLEFKHENSQSPFELDKSSDTRKVGMAIKEISFNEC